MRTLRRILFAVRNPDARRQPGVLKAAAIAKSLGASLELFHAISSPVFMELQPLTGNSIADLKREALDLRERRLERAAKEARALGVTVTCNVVWDYPPHEAIVRRAARGDADLIIAECHKGLRSKAWLMHLTDWELLRTSPLPVLLMRNTRPYRHPVLLAAVDPGHAHAKPADLDTNILESARGFADALRGKLHVLHANNPNPFGIVMIDPALDASSLAVGYERLSQQARDDFRRFSDDHEVPRARRHLVDGDPVFVLPKVARKLRAGLVVMGAVSRSGLKRVFIGNTAERVLGALPCDVLVVKPQVFRKRLRPTMRGMNVVAAPSVLSMPV